MLQNVHKYRCVYRQALLTLDLKRITMFGSGCKQMLKKVLDVEFSNQTIIQLARCHSNALLIFSHSLATNNLFSFSMYHWGFGQ